MKRKRRDPNGKAQLKKKLWGVFTRYVKERDNWTCVTCGRYARGSGMGGGHYIAKGACRLTYYFSERNVHAQCTYCNLTLEGNRPAYRAFILRRYGADVLRDLENNHGGSDYWTAQEFKEKISYYKAKIDEISLRDMQELGASGV